MGRGRGGIGENFARWASQRVRAYWESQITTMLTFADQRPARFREHVVAYFDEVSGTAELEIAGLDGTGTVRLYTIPLEAGWPGVEIIGGTWRGELFTGMPVVLSAEGVDLTNAQVWGDVVQVEATKEALSFVMNGLVRVEVR